MLESAPSPLAFLNPAAATAAFINWLFPAFYSLRGVTSLAVNLSITFSTTAIFYELYYSDTLLTD